MPCGNQCCCPSGLTRCGNGCANLKTDPQHCGSCNASCPTGYCSNGGCGCPPGTSYCNGSCFNLKTDPQHCGSCTTVCPSGVCQNGVCQPAKTCSGLPVQNPQLYTYFVESRPSMCQVGSFTYLANSQAEADQCAQRAWPSGSFAIGPISTVQQFNFAAVCGSSCVTWTVAALSSDDAKNCVDNENVGCSVTAGVCP